jgi:hypothetical protein
MAIFRQLRSLRYHVGVLERLFRRNDPEPTGISILLLQKRLNRFSTEELNLAMQRGWRRAYDPEKFFASSIFDGDGAVLKVGTFYVTMRHFDRRLEAEQLGDLELPNWAVHSGYSSVEYKCPSGVPEGEQRDFMYGFLALLCAELLTENSSGIFFLEERVTIPNDSQFRERLRSGQPLNPHILATEINR